MRLSFFVLLLRWMISDSDIAIKAVKWPNRQYYSYSTPHGTKGVVLTNKRILSYEKRK